MGTRSLKRHSRLLVAALALGLVAAACGDDDDGGESASDTTAAAATTAAPTDTTTGGDTTAASAEATTTTAGATSSAAPADDEECTADKAGGTVTVGTSSPFTSVDPTLVLGTGAVGGDYMSAIYDTLMRYDARTQEFEPNVAESLEPNADFTEWTLTLKPGITFGNGDPLTTADVQFNVERMQQARVRAAGMATQIVGMTIVDDLTMTFDVGAPWGMFPYVLATEPGWIANKNVVEQLGEGFGTNPAGAGVGPYEFTRFAEGEEIVLTAKDNYWGGQACIETLRFIYVPGADASYDAFSTGQIDVLFINEVTKAAEARDAGLLDFEVGVGALNYVLADQGITGSGETAFQDVRVREAMQLAMDYDLINERLYEGLSEVDSALVPASSPIYHGIEGPPSDPERAAQLVQETIADGTWDGSFTFTHGNTPQATDQAVLFEGLWEAAGMDVTLEAVPNVGERVILERRFEVSTNGFAILDPAPWSTVNGLASDSVRQRTGYANPEMDAALVDLRAAATIDETKAALGAMQEVWNETFPLIVVNHGIWGYAVAERVHGMTYGPDNTPYFNKAFVDQ